MNSPLLSVVIANYNYGRFIGQAINSVLCQTCLDFELIIIDGGSTDDSIEIIKKHAGGLPAGELSRLGVAQGRISYWISEKDKGQSDAFNKGFAKARGRFLTWLNADDVMLPGAIENLKSAVSQHPECKWFVGGSIWTDPEMKVVKCCRARSFPSVRAKFGQLVVWGPSSFFAKDLFIASGGMDERFHYMMDIDLWLRFAKRGVVYRPMSDYAWVLRMHPASKMSGHKFSHDGTLIKRILSDEERHAKQLQVELQKDKEVQWIQQKYATPKVPALVRFATIPWLDVLRDRVNSRRYRGRDYRDMLG